MDSEGPENENNAVSEDEDSGLESQPDTLRAGIWRLLGKKLTLLILLGCFSGALAVGFALWGLSACGTPEKAVKKYAPSREPFISSSRAGAIREKRGRMRNESRSSHNKHLVIEKDSHDMFRSTSRAELSLLSGLFKQYIEVTACFFELLRTMSNSYVREQWQVNTLFHSEFLPGYNNMERRRKHLKRRITLKPALDLYNRLSYIASHDSIAVGSFSSFLEDRGRREEFTLAVESANTAKLMLKDFWRDFSCRLGEYNLDFQPRADIWNRYFGTWDNVEQ